MISFLKIIKLRLHVLLSPMKKSINNKDNLISNQESEIENLRLKEKEFEVRSMYLIFEKKLIKFVKIF